MEAMLRSFYAEYAPEKLTQMDKILAHFSDRIPALVQSLEAKYSVAFLPDGKWIEADSEADFL